mmetsp:Transcript_26681/g.73586  ORF Transcript_26681/g.73586 Transcript_26681/m.73586 type:complete len:239 (-) Transcript_26681:184-900(-)
MPKPAHHVNNTFSKLVTSVGRQTSIQKSSQSLEIVAPNGLAEFHAVTCHLNRGWLVVVGGFQRKECRCRVSSRFDHGIKVGLWRHVVFCFGLSSNYFEKGQIAGRNFLLGRTSSPRRPNWGFTIRRLRIHCRRAGTSRLAQRRSQGFFVVAAAVGRITKQGFQDTARLAARFAVNGRSAAKHFERHSSWWRCDNIFSSIGHHQHCLKSLRDALIALVGTEIVLFIKGRCQAFSPHESG